MQTRRTFRNITSLLEAEGARWEDIVRTTCYLCDIGRDYDAFNQERTAFYESQKLNPLPASTAVQALPAVRNCWWRSRLSPCSGSIRMRSRRTDRLA